jgi:hypothetical protein
MKKVLYSLLISLALVSAGHAAVVDFEDVWISPGTQVVYTSPVISGGFEYGIGPLNNYYKDLHINSVTSFPYNSTTVGLTHRDAVLTQVGGGAFSIQSFDFAGFPGYEGAFSVTGIFLDGGIITANITPDGLVDGIGGVADFQTFSLGSEWANLAKVYWTYSGDVFALDNFMVDGAARSNVIDTQVPEPATMLLLSFGIIGLAGVRRLNSKLPTEKKV